MTEQHENMFTIDPSEVGDLPERLQNIFRPKRRFLQQTLILDLLKKANRPLCIDELIIGLYKVFNYEVTSRFAIYQYLRRMIKSGLISKYRDKQNYYHLTNKQEI